jgi:protein TonB
MKTKTNLSDTRTLDDIVFENRNKAYGAYALNKKHRKYLLIAFLISLTGISTAIAFPFLKALNGQAIFSGLERVISTTLQPAQPEAPIPPPPPPAPPLKDLARQISYKPPQVVENAQEDYIPPMEALIDRPHNAPLIDNIPEPVAPTPEIEEPKEEGLINPQEYASFMNGGIDEFRKWVLENIIYPEIAKESNIAGKVFIAFCVNKKGEVVDIEILRGLDKSVDQETIRVISSSPLWKPARQAGNPVKQKFVIPISFVLN